MNNFEELHQQWLEKPDNEFLCDDCGRTVNQEFITSFNNDGLFICDNCLGHYFECYGCGTTFFESEINFTDEGLFCDECYLEDEVELECIGTI